MSKEREYTVRVCREYPGRQYGTATVMATSKAKAEDRVASMEASFSWEQPEFTSGLGDCECGDVEILD